MINYQEPKKQGHLELKPLTEIPCFHLVMMLSRLKADVHKAHSVIENTLQRDCGDEGVKTVRILYKFIFDTNDKIKQYEEAIATLREHDKKVEDKSYGIWIDEQLP